MLFDPHPDDFARTVQRRPFRGAPHIIRTSMLQEMLGGPTAHMLQEMARTQNGDIHLALSGPAAQLLFQEAGLDTTQFRHRMMSRYMPIRSGRTPNAREGGLSSSMATAHRWAEEARVNANPSYDERLAEFSNHIVVILLPAAREAARIDAEETAKREKEAEAKEKAEREAAERAEVEEKARLEAEAALERQRQQEISAPIPATTEDATTDVDAQIVDAESSETTAPPEAPTNQAPATTSAVGEPETSLPSTSERPRVTVMYRGASVDITDADIDPDFLNAVPEDIRDEIIGNFVREQQRQTRPTRAPEADMDMEFLNALPAEMREEVLRSQMQTIAHMAGAVDMDAASVLATLTDELRQTVLLEQDDAILEAMPSSVLAEANALRAQRMGRRALPTMSQPNLLTGIAQPSRKSQHRETAQLLDKSGLAHLVRLLFYIDDARRVSLQQVLVNLAENGKSRTDLLNLLLGLLNGTKADLSIIDKSFAQLTLRNAKATGKGKQREEAGTATDRTPEEHVVVGRTLDALTLVVQANDAASLFFLTEQDVPIALQRSSKKGKGKEKAGALTYYPFVQLLALLERQNMAQQVHSLDSISGLLCTVTKPLAVLREPPKPVEPSSEAAVPADSAVTEPEAMTAPASSETQQAPAPTGKKENYTDEQEI
jgi:E3 ubiquitin-protein ligase HUWE1